MVKNNEIWLMNIEKPMKVYVFFIENSEICEYMYYKFRCKIGNFKDIHGK